MHTFKTFLIEGGNAFEDMKRIPAAIKPEIHAHIQKMFPGAIPVGSFTDPNRDSGDADVVILHSYKDDNGNPLSPVQSKHVLHTDLLAKIAQHGVPITATRILPSSVSAAYKSSVGNHQIDFNPVSDDHPEAAEIAKFALSSNQSRNPQTNKLEANADGFNGVGRAQAFWRAVDTKTGGEAAIGKGAKRGSESWNQQGYGVIHRKQDSKENIRRVDLPGEGSYGLRFAKRYLGPDATEEDVLGAGSVLKYMDARPEHAETARLIRSDIATREAAAAKTAANRAAKKAANEGV